MEEELISRILKMEKELRNAKFLIIFLIVMFIMIGYQFLSVQQRDVRYLNTLRTRGIILEDPQGNEAMYLGSPVSMTDTGNNMKGRHGVFIMDQDGIPRLMIGHIKNDSINGLKGSSWGYQVSDEKGNIRGRFLMFDPADTVIHTVSDQYKLSK